MAKHLSKDKWIKIFDVLKESGIIEAISLYKKLHKTNKPIKYYSAYCLIRQNWILFNNISMVAFKKRQGSGRSHKKIDNNSDIPSIIDSMNEEQKREVIEVLRIELKAKISYYHRTTFSNKSKKKNI